MDVEAWIFRIKKIKAMQCFLGMKKGGEIVLSNTTEMSQNAFGEVDF